MFLALTSDGSDRVVEGAGVGRVRSPAEKWEPYKMHAGLASPLYVGNAFS